MSSLYEQLMTMVYGMWRRRWYGLAAMWAVCLGGWIVVAIIPNQYQSDARIYAKFNSVLPDAISSGGGDKLAQVDVVRQTLTSRPNLEKVVRRTDLAQKIEQDSDLDRIIGDLTANITIKSQQDNLFTITYTSKDPEFADAQNAGMAQRVVQNLINIFVEENISSDRDNLNQAIRFFEDQLAQRARELEEVEKRKSQFEQRYLGRMPGSGDISSRMAASETELSRVEQELVQANGSLRALRGQLRGTPATIPSPLFNVGGEGFSGTRYDPASTRGRIESLERQVSEAYARGWTDQHPDVVNARRKIAELQVKAASEPPPAGPRQQAAQSNPVYANLRSLLFDKESQVAALSARRSQLVQDMTDLRGKQTEEPGIAAEQSKIMRDYDVLKRQYAELLKSREEVRLKSDVETKTDQIQFQIIDPPSFPREPVAPNRPLLLSAVLAAGLGAGIALAFLIGQVRTTYITPTKLAETFGVPVLGSVSAIVSEQQSTQARVWLYAFAILGIGLVGLYGVLLTLQLLSDGGVA